MTNLLFPPHTAARLALAALLLGLAGTACAPAAPPATPTPALAPTTAPPTAPPPTAATVAPTSPPTQASSATASAVAIAQPTAAPPGAATPVRVVLDEWSVAPSVASVPAGEVTFDVANVGKLGHELIVV